MTRMTKDEETGSLTKIRHVDERDVRSRRELYLKEPKILFRCFELPSGFKMQILVVSVC